MKFKLHYINLFALSLFYVGSATASLVETSYSGEIHGFNTDVGSVFVTFTYDTVTPSSFTGSAYISGFGDFAANNFTFDSKNNTYLFFSAPVVEGQTTSSLHLFGSFYDYSPSIFSFSSSSYAIGTSFGAPHFDVVLDNLSAVTTPVSTVPVPAAVWLFGSGLIGLIGFARRKKA